MSLTAFRRPGPLRAIAGNLGWLLASNGLMAALSLIYIGIASRTLGIVDFGRFALVTGACQTIATLVSFEGWKLVVQYGLKHLKEGDPEAIRRIEKAAIYMDLASAAIGILVATLLFLFARPLVGIKGSIGPYALGYAIIQLATLRSAPVGILRLHDRFDLAAIADSATPVFRLIGALLALFYMPTVKGFLTAWAVAEVITWLAYWLMVHRLGRLRGLMRGPLDHKTLLRENPGIFNMMLSTNFQSTLGLASRQLPLLVVGGYAGPAAAGGFRLAHQLASALSKVSSLITRAAFPELIRQLHDTPDGRVGKIIGRITLGSALGAGLVMILVILFGRELLVAIGGKQFAPAYVLLLWLAGGACVELAAISFEPILQALNRAGTAIVARGAAVIIQFAAMVVLLPAWGAMGAAVSMLIGATFAFCFLGLTVRQQAVINRR